MKKRMSETSLPIQPSQVEQQDVDPNVRQLPEGLISKDSGTEGITMARPQMAADERHTPEGTALQMENIHGMLQRKAERVGHKTPEDFRKTDIVVGDRGTTYTAARRSKVQEAGGGNIADTVTGFLQSNGRSSRRVFGHTSTININDFASFVDKAKIKGDVKTGSTEFGLTTPESREVVAAVAKGINRTLNRENQEKQDALKQLRQKSA